MKKIGSIIAAMVIAVNMFAFVNVSAAETAVSKQSALENVALGKSVTVSGISAGSKAHLTDGTTEVSHMGLAEAFDGYCTLSPDDSDTAWAIVDLGRAYDISQVTVNVHGYYGNKLTMSVSTDGVTWSKGWAKTSQDDSWLGDTNTFTNTFYYNYGAKNVRYVKVSAAGSVIIGEISVYSALGYNSSKLGIAGVNTSDDSEGSIYGAIDNNSSAQAWQDKWMGTNTTGETIDATFELLGTTYVDTVYLTPHSEASVMNNFKVYAGTEVGEDGHVAKTEENLVFEQGEENYTDLSIATMGITVNKTAKYITVSRNAMAAGEENKFSLANFAAYGGVASTENVELTNVALGKPVISGSQANDTMGFSRINDGGKGAGHYSYCSAEWDFNGVVIDLGAWYNVRKIDLTMPLTGTSMVTNNGNRHFFEVWGSARENFDNSAICLMDTGETIRGDGETVSEEVKVANIVRYIKVKHKTSLSSLELADFSNYFTFQEIEVYADASKEYTLADGSLFTAAADGSSDYVAVANLGDGDSSTKADMGSKTGFTLNLGQAYNVAAIQLVSNNTNYSYGNDSSNSVRRGFALTVDGNNVAIRNMRDFPSRSNATYILDETAKTQNIGYTKKISDGCPSFTMASIFSPYHPTSATYFDTWNDTAYTNINLGDMNVFCLPLEEVTVSNAVFAEDALMLGYYTFTASVRNGTKEDVKVMTVISQYDSKGVLKKVISSNFAGENVKANGGNLSVYGEFDEELDNYAEGDIVKALIWNAATYEPYYGETVIK